MMTLMKVLREIMRRDEMMMMMESMEITLIVRTRRDVREVDRNIMILRMIMIVLILFIVMVMRH